MDTPDGGAYWGSVGFPLAGFRHSGAGEYAGVLVVLVAFFGAANAFRKSGNPYDDGARRIIKFWTIAAIVSILFAWGRWAPFYKLLYPLPFFSTIRNPIKFMHFFHLAMLILFGYGLDLLFRGYVEKASANVTGIKSQFQKWWSGAAAFERKIVGVMAVGLAASAVGFLIYSTSRLQLERYLHTVGFPEAAGPVAKQIVSFSFGEVGKYLVVYALSLAAIVACLCGVLRGRAAPLLVGIFLALDLGRANTPWIKYINYKQKYASTDLTDFLKKDSLEHRVTTRVGPFTGMYFVSREAQGMLPAVFSDLLQHQFQYNNIQSLDIVQFPRQPYLDTTFSRAFLVTNAETLPRGPRLWELSNTRYILGQKVDLLDAVDAGQKRIRLLTNFNYAIRPGLPPGSEPTLDDITWQLAPQGPLSLFEFTGALPRYKLFSSWAQSTNDTATLDTLRKPDFDPHTQLLVNDEAVASFSGGGTNAGSAQVVSYSPKRIELKAQATANSILLWNDRWAPNWKATVDGQPVRLLRCNFIMRGIQVSPGAHEIVMKYEQPAKYLWVSFASAAVGFVLCGFLAFEGRKKS
jgi:hypothetical protein